uniref:WG repeat-containing protein n=1 Tax=Panagrolaimus sp. JU765 TaxID=591449 RepID=A0AC34RLS1_9BILA
MVTDPETKGCGRYEYVDEEFSQFNALKNKYFYRSKGEKKTFEDFSSFGDVTIYKFDGSKKILIKDENGKELNTEWKADYDYTFDNNQARGKVELPFSKNYFGIKFVEEKNGKCFVGFSDLMTGEGKKRVGIPCNAPDTIGSYGIVQDSDGNYRLRACFLDYKNVVPFLRCFVKKDESFIQEFSHQFQKCDFTLYDIDDDEIHFRQRFRLLPNIIIGPLQGTSSKLNGILIDFAEKSCKLDVKDGKITNETVVEPDEFGRGFDSIRDDFLVRSKLPFDFKSMKEILSKHSPIMSTGSNVFFKGRGNKWIVVDPTGTRAEYSGDYESVVDDSFLKLI